MKSNPHNELLKKLSEGDHKSFDTLFLTFAPKVKYFLMGFIKDEEVANDMVQDIFYKVWKNRQQLIRINSLSAYLFRIARNAVYDHYEHSLVIDNYLQKQEANPTYTDLIEEDIYAKELELLIDISIEKMPEQRKRIFKLSRKEGLTNEEIAQQLGINKRTVENHITQALSDLRKVIQAVLIFFI